MSPVPTTFAAAVEYHRFGRLDQAERLYRDLLHTDPQDADALHGMGLLSYQLGRHEDAVDYLGRAVSLRTDSAVFHNNLGNAYLALGKLNLATTSYARAVEIKPDYAAAHSNLGNALRDQGRFEDAVASCQRALAIEPGFGAAHNNLGNALRDFGKLDEAVSCFRRAIEIKPDYADAHFNLGNCLTDQGRLEQAIASFQRALKIKPDFTQAYAHLVHCRRNSDADKDVLEQLNRLLAGGNLTPAQRCHSHFTLGKIYDDCQDYDLSFEHYQKGNSLASVRFDARRHADAVEAVIATCTRSLLQQGAEIGNPSELPVLIVGMPRSGTSLVEQILASHPAISGAGELPDLYRYERALPAALNSNSSYPACLAELDRSTAGEFAGSYLARLETFGSDAVRVTDKMPGNFNRLGLVALLLPQTRIIHCRRHPLDVCLSCYFRDFTHRRQLSFAYDLRSLGLYYRQYEKLMEHWRQVLPLRLFEIDYEQLVAEPEAASRQLLEFCGLPWDPACLEFHKTERVVRTASKWQVRQPIYQSAVGRWRQYEKYLGPLKDALGGFK